MIAVTYKKNLKEDGVVYFPFKDCAIVDAKKRADRLYREGFLNVKVVKVEEKILYIPSAQGGKE